MLSGVREKIREIDTEIIHLIAKRTSLASEVLEAKKKTGTPINDENQNQTVLERAARLAAQQGLDTENVQEIFKILIQMNIDRQQELDRKN